MSLSDEQQAIKDEFIRIRGVWGDHWESILRIYPEFMRAYLNFSSVPWKKNRLDDRTKVFIYIAVDAAATHLYARGIRSIFELLRVEAQRFERLWKSWN